MSRINKRRRIKMEGFSNKRRRTIGTGEGGIEMGVGRLGSRVWRGLRMEKDDQKEED
jgi:hypothetical protein